MTLRVLALHVCWGSGNNPHFAIIPRVKTMELWFALLLVQGLTTLPGFLCFACASLPPLRPFIGSLYN